MYEAGSFFQRLHLVEDRGERLILDAHSRGGGLGRPRVSATTTAICSPTKRTRSSGMMKRSFM